MPDSGCFACIHHPVCKHWLKWEEHFPYKGDDKIAGYLRGLADTLSAACHYFKEA